MSSSRVAFLEASSVPRFLLSRTSFCADDRTAFQHAARPGAGCRVDCESSSGRHKRPFCHMWANTNQFYAAATIRKELYRAHLQLASPRFQLASPRLERLVLGVHVGAALIGAVHLLLRRAYKHESGQSAAVMSDRNNGQHGKARRPACHKVTGRRTDKAKFTPSFLPGPKAPN